MLLQNGLSLPFTDHFQVKLHEMVQRGHLLTGKAQNPPC